MQKSLPNVEPWGCHGLFSEHYVEKRFRETEKYRKLIPPDGVWENVQALVQKNINTVAAKNEAQLEEALIRPLLRELGIDFLPAVALPQGEVDYAYFTNEEIKKAADARHYEKYKGAIALADAKRWDRPLDKGGGNDQDKYPNAVPTKQIRNYISETGIEWGVLTNGRIWRLYNRNVFPVSESYFWVNLLGALEERDTFNLFYALFSGAAFTEEAQKFVLKESEDYWAEIGEDLKEKAYKALELLCNGFRKLNPGLEIRDVYEGAVILLYRLLFILYAENKKLLPRDEEAYKRYSLKSILDEVDRGDVETFSGTRDALYGRLKNLFRLIDEGEPSLNVYQYNGGLFKEQGLPFLPPDFLAANVVPDRFLAKALKLIAYTEGKKNRGRHLVDYGELDVRHLGSIYEGLLEFHPAVAGDKIELYTDKGERKETGSYYTPGYIVDYIVENTLGPLTEKLTGPEEVLTLKVLDPAMGSGHFLVGAVDFIGRRCAELAGEEAEKTEKDYQREAVERCIYGVDLNPLAVELAKLSLWLHTVAKDKPLSFLDHHLKLGNSLVGARVDDLGELPQKNKKKKAAATQNLFATRLEQAMATAIKEVMGILGRGTEAIEDVAFKEESLKRAEKRLAPFNAVADTWVSTYFGNDVTDAAYAEALAALARKAEETLALAPVGEAVRMSHGDEHGVGREFFHWELEFPEVFYDDFGRPKDNSGFDAVIGNPPWGAPIDKEIKYLLSDTWNRVETNVDSYMLFILLGLEKLNSRGKCSEIIPDTWLTIQGAANFRSILLGSQRLEHVLDMYKPFVSSKDTRCHIVLIGDEHYEGVLVKHVRPGKELDDLKERFFYRDYLVGYTDILDIHEKGCWLYLNKGERNISVKMDLYGDPLDNLYFIRYGLRTGNNKKYLTPQKNESTGIPVIEGKNIERYYKSNLSRYIKLKNSLPKAYFSAELKVDKIIIQYVRTNSMAPDARWLEATFLRSNVVPLNSLNYITNVDNEYGLLYLLSLINSFLMNKYYRFYYTDVNVKPLYLSKLPIRKIHFSTDPATWKRSTAELVELYDANNYGEIKSQIESYLPKDAGGEFLAFKNGAKRAVEKSDVVHDFLAFLAQQMLDMNAEKQRFAREFLGWLDGETAGNLDDFRPKKYQEFWNYDFDEFYKWLTKNHEDFKAAGHAKLQAEFDKYKGKVVVLNDKIERTDHLIDDIVYILYGLTEEEIEIVEGSFKGKGN